MIGFIKRRAATAGARAVMLVALCASPTVARAQSQADEFGKKLANSR